MKFQLTLETDSDVAVAAGAVAAVAAVVAVVVLVMGTRLSQELQPAAGLALYGDGQLAFTVSIRKL